ncbi:N-acetyltransferase, partial [Shewanella sp. 10N.286.45.A1]
MSIKVQLTWLAADNRNEVKKFYRQHMPYARLLQKESVCVLSQTDPNLDSLGEIIAAARIRPIGQLAI